MTIYLIRHGEAAQAWDKAPDPGLSETGKEQAIALAKEYLPIVQNNNFQFKSYQKRNSCQSWVEKKLIDTLIIIHLTVLCSDKIIKQWDFSFRLSQTIIHKKKYIKKRKNL